MERALRFGQNEVEPDVRKLSEMRDVIYDIDWLKAAPDRELYYYGTATWR